MLDIQALQHSGVLFAHRYRIERLLGRGGFSEVWLACDVTAKIKVALKIYIADGNALDDEGIAMFRKEFAIVCNINHSNLLRPFTFDIEQGHPYLVLPFCERGSSARLVGKLSESQLWNFVCDVAKGLEHLHGQPESPIVHQDIKPDNVLISPSGNYVITDFGVSVGMRRTMRRSVDHGRTVSGTLAYMGPERFGGDAHPIMANDIWSLGATLYELATGALPFGENGGLNQKRGATVPKITSDYSKDLKRLINSCLSPEPWQRPTAGQLVASCSTHSFNRFHSRFPKTRLAIASLGAVAMAALCIVVLKMVMSPPIEPEDAQTSELLNHVDRVVAAQDSVTQNGKNMVSVDENALVQSFLLIDSARRTSDDETVRARCDTLEGRVVAMARNAYNYFLQEERYSNEIEAYERAKSFKHRKDNLNAITMHSK